MFRCWHTDPEERQTFSELVRIMSQTLLTMADYLDVSTFGELEETAKEEAAKEEEAKEETAKEEAKEETAKEEAKEETAKEEAKGETAKEEEAKEVAGEESNCSGVDKEEDKLPKDSAYYNNESKSLILNLTA